MRDQRELPRIVRFMTAPIACVVAVAVLGGVGSAAFGGSLTDLGNGFGGLWGLPAVLLTLIALILGAAAAIRIIRGLSPESDRINSGGIELVFVAHTFDTGVDGIQQPVLDVG